MSAMEPVGSGNKPPESNLSDEFREFGRQLASLLKVVRDSPRAREIEQQLTGALREMEHQVNEALATARDRTQAQNLSGTIKGAAGTAADETQRGLAHGLHRLNERMDKWIQDAESRRAGVTISAPTDTPDVQAGHSGENPPGNSTS